MKLLKSLLKLLQPSDRNLDGAMQQILAPTAVNSRLEKWSPWKPFPNVKDFKVELSPLDELFAKFGIVKRLEKATMVYTQYKNRDINRFVEHQIIRLRASNDRAFGTIAMALMLRSNVGFLLGLKHVVPNGHRNMNFQLVLDLFKKYKKLVSGDIDKNIDYKRVYVLKANKKWRPLGVPKLVGRVYLHNLNQFLVCRLNDQILSSQHGFRPGLGTLTAGLEIFDKAGRAKYIYEYDYKAFFPSVEITYISDVLRKYGVPAKIVHLIENLNKSQPKLAKEDKMDESKVRQYQDLSRWLETGENPSGPSGDIIRARIVETFGTDKVHESELLQECLLEGVPEYGTLSDIRHRPNAVLLKYVEVQWALLSSYGMGAFYSMLRGVPQGSPTSPFLSILAEDDAVRPSLPPHVNRIAYADDGILYSDQDFEVKPTEKMERAGIEYSPEKCAGVKRDGVWLRPLKFLGLSGDGTEFSANTRNGSRLIYDKASLLEAVEEGYIHGGRNSASRPMKGDTWEQFIKSKYAGWIQSRLYNGSGNQEKYWQNFELRFHTGSGVGGYLKGVKQPQRGDRAKAALAESLTIFNSSSIATRSVLEAFRIIEGRKPKRPTPTPARRIEEVEPTAKAKASIAKALEDEANKEGENQGGSKQKGNFRDYSKWNQRRGAMGYCANLIGFTSFITKEIDRMAPYSKYSKEEMHEHYLRKYIERKIKYGQDLYLKGARIIRECEEIMKSFQ